VEVGGIAWFTRGKEINLVTKMGRGYHKIEDRDRDRDRNQDLK
jgi:hypothetical protein